MTEIEKINAMLEANTQVFSEYDLEGVGYDISSDFDFYYGSNEAEVAIATYADDYQIVTNHVIDMVDMTKWKDLDGVEHETETIVYNEYYESLSHEEQERYDNGWTELYESFIASRDEGAYKQYWFNVKTGACYVRDRLYQHPKYGLVNNVGGEWTPLRQIDASDATDEACYMVDFCVHPDLEAMGYDGWSAYEYNEYSYNGNPIENRITFWKDMMQNPQLSIALHYGGLEMLSHVYGERSAEYIAAVKIANRHHYMPDNKKMWMDYLRDLIELGKDLHNPFYVCPEDLRAAHEKYHKLYVKNLKKIQARRQEEEQRRKLLAMKESIEKYADRITPFLNLAWTTDQYAVFVCPSVEEMINEGSAMHHCVGSEHQAYYNKPDSLILFCRTPNGDRISTIEYSISKGKVLQNRAACNKVPLYLEEVNKMLEKDADRIRACKLININKSKVQPAATAIALAA